MKHIWSWVQPDKKKSNSRNPLNSGEKLIPQEKRSKPKTDHFFGFWTVTIASLNPFKPINIKFEFELEIWYGAPKCYANVWCKKIRIFFPYLICYSFCSYSNFNQEFCVVLCNAFGKWYAKKLRKFIYDFLMYVNFSYISAPKPVGRIDLCRFEMVKICAVA